ncbi:hypothetical protein QQX98_004373 [Neonectria punicea]|uniref:Transcription factor domain-containing protein n=1 Tax=Neonectria punicea TaxID=979145 RepID=A0ABR1H9C1_9HYPO
MALYITQHQPGLSTDKRSRKKFATPPTKSACTAWSSPPDPGSRIQDNATIIDDQLGVLPHLYSDDLGATQFDDIFRGDSDEALDKFFAEVFGLPSYPPVGATVEDVVHSPGPQHIHVLRRYKSDDDVVQAYYELIHPVFPTLPPPLEQDVQDRAEVWVPTGQFFSDYEPSSPLILALLSILVLLPHSQDEHASDETGRELRAEYAQSLAQCAVESIKIASEMESLPSPSSTRSSIHHCVPVELETPMALCVLSIYQYLHNGNVEKMRQLAEEAFDLSVNLSLHAIPEDETPFSEARRRTWWMSYLCICNACTVSCKSPEYKVGVYLRKLTWVRLTSANIKTHQYRAFMGSPAVLKKFELLPSLDTLERSTGPNNSISHEETDVASQIFPFTVPNSILIYLEASTKMAACLELMSTDIRVAPFACSAALAGYTALMMYHFQSSTEVPDELLTLPTDVLRDQCKKGVQAALNALDNFSMGFRSMRTLSGELFSKTWKI